MPKNSVTYLQVAEACQSLLAEGQKITSRALLARCGGSPNELAVHRKKWQTEQDDIALVAIDEELSPPVKQVVRHGSTLKNPQQYEQSSEYRL